VTLTGPAGGTESLTPAEIEPGNFEAVVAAAPRGVYRARSGDLFAVGAVGLAAPPEFENVVSNAQKLAPLIARAGGGAFSVRRGETAALPAIRKVKAGASAYAGAGWAGIASRSAFRTDAIADRPPAPPVAWLLILAAAFAGAWWIEGRGARAISPRRGRQV
jgi:hypothetical protein